MGSNRRSGLPRAGRESPTKVLVSLDALFPDETTAPAVREGLILHGWTTGVLHRWLRSSSGAWIGVVTLRIRTTSVTSHLGTHAGDGDLFRDQLVPAQALRRDTT